MLRQAEPEPRRAKRDKSFAERFNPKATLQAPAKAARPLAEEAKPARHKILTFHFCKPSTIGLLTNKFKNSLTFLFVFRFARYHLK